MWAAAAAAVATMDPGQSIKINPSLSSSIHVNMLHARELPAQDAGGGLPPPTYRIHLGNKQSSCRTTCCASRAQTMADHVGQMSASHKINELNHVKNKAKASSSKAPQALPPAAASSFIKLVCIWPRKPPAVDTENSTSSQLHYVFYLVKHLRRTATHSCCKHPDRKVNCTFLILCHLGSVCLGFFVKCLMHKQMLCENFNCSSI